MSDWFGMTDLGYCHEWKFGIHMCEHKEVYYSASVKDVHCCVNQQVSEFMIVLQLCRCRNPVP